MDPYNISRTLQLVIGQTSTTTPTVDGSYQYCVVATTASGCASEPVCTTILVNPLPVCSINGPDNVCPSSSNVYAGPAGMTAYVWSVIAGTATIQSGGNTQNATVVAGTTCGTYTLQLIVTDANGCASTPCTATYNITDTEKPTVTGTTNIDGTVCNVAPTYVDPVAVDNCNPPRLKVGYPITSATSTVNCVSTETRTWIYVDSCGNESDPFIQTITWPNDTELPLVTGTATINSTTCNVIPAFVDPVATDNCGTPTLLAGYPVESAVTNLNCDFTQTKTWIFVDACGNQSLPFVQTITWTQDTEVPTVTGQATVVGTTCNVAPAFVDPVAVDNCGTPTVLTGYPQTTAVSTVNCTSSQTRTWIFVDACGNQSAPFDQTISWTQDTEVPQVTGQPAIGGTGCNSPPAFVDPVATDNCGIPTLQTGYPQTSVASTVNCVATQTRTWVFVDACGNESAPFVQTITWTQDTEVPVCNRNRFNNSNRMYCRSCIY
jgi:hypothetical protein